MDDDLEVSPSLAEKRRRYFEARDKNLREKKAFRRLEVDSGPKGPQFVMVLLCLLGIALVSFQIFGPALYGTDDEDLEDVFPGEEIEEGESAAVRLDPEEMRSHLTRFELALYEPSEPTFEGIVNDLIAEADRFLGMLRNGEGDRRQALAEELDEITTPLREENFDLDGLETLRTQWPAVRGRNFFRAPWLYAPGETVQSSSATYAVYRDLAEELLRQVGSGLSAAEDAIEENAGIGTLERDQPARNELLEDWKETAADWHDEIEILGGSLPDRPGPDSPDNLLVAVHRLETALDESKSAMPGDRLPTTADLAALEETLARAQFALEAFDDLTR